MTERLPDLQKLAANLAKDAVQSRQPLRFQNDAYVVREADWDVFWGKYPGATRHEEMLFGDAYALAAEKALNSRT